MKGKSSRSSGIGQPDLGLRQELFDQMGVAGFVPGTQKAYSRALDQFVASLKGGGVAATTVKDAKAYLAGLKRAGKSQSVHTNAQCALRFFFEKVRRQEWEPVSPLRRRMIEDMRLHGFSARTQDSYVRSVLGLAGHYDRSPDLLSEEEIREYFVHLTCERKLARPTITITLCGIKFFYEKTLKRDWSLTERSTQRAAKVVGKLMRKLG